MSSLDFARSVRSKIDFQVRSTALIWHLIQDSILLFAVFASWSYLGIFSFFATIPLTIFLYRKFALFHEAVHGVAHTNKVINDLVGLMVSPFCFFPFIQWKASHLKHHLWSGNIDQDPVMGFRKVYPSLSSGFQRILNFCWKNWIPALALIQHGVFWRLSLKSFVSNDKSVMSMISLIVPVLTWSLILLSVSADFLTLVLLPSFVLYLVGTEVLNFPHHLDMHYETGNTRFSHFEQYLTARSCHYPKFLGRFVFLNFNYHIEHHMFPDAPWYSLEGISNQVQIGISDRYRFDEGMSWIIQARKKDLMTILLSEGELVRSDVKQRDVA